MPATSLDFNQYRPLLFSIAYRMLGSVMDAEDMVQEAYLRWQNAEADAVQSPKSYLTTVITRLCIDHLRSARVKREEYIGPWLPEPLVGQGPPEGEDAAMLSESLSMAFLVLLESLSPTERAVFLLREVFDYDYAEIARIVGKSEANCRQMLQRGRQHIQSHRHRYDVDREQGQRLLAQFGQTLATGDMPSLLAMLSPNVTAWCDGGGKALAARNPIYGADRVARFLFGIASKTPTDTTVRFADVNGQPGVIVYVNNLPYLVLLLDIVDGMIEGVRLVLNPDKLTHVPSLA